MLSSVFLLIWKILCSTKILIAPYFHHSKRRVLRPLRPLSPSHLLYLSAPWLAKIAPAVPLSWPILLPPGDLFFCIQGLLVSVCSCRFIWLLTIKRMVWTEDNNVFRVLSSSNTLVGRGDHIGYFAIVKKGYEPGLLSTELGHQWTLCFAMTLMWFILSPLPVVCRCSSSYRNRVEIVFPSLLHFCFAHFLATF